MRIIEKKIIALSILFGLSVWVVDTIFDYFIFYEGSFWNLLIFDIPNHEIYIRSVILGFFLCFGAIVGRITARREEAEQSLRESEEKFRTTLNSIGDAVITTDLNEKILHMNPVAQQLTAWELEQAKGKPLGEVFHIIHAHSKEPAKNPVPRVLKEGIIVGLANHTMLIARDGSRHHIADSAAPIRNQTGEITGVVLVFRDVTEEYQLHTALQESEELLRAASHNLDGILYAFDLDLRFTLSRGLKLQAFGLAQDQVVGSTIYDFFQTDDSEHPTIRKHLKALAGEDLTIEEWVKGILWSIRLSPLRNADGEITGVSGLAVDITEQRQTENELRETNELFSLFIKHSPIYAFIKEVTPTESRTLRASDNYKDMIGIPGPEMIGKTMQEIFPAELADKITTDDWISVANARNLHLEEDLNDRHYTTFKFPIRLGEKNLLAGYTIDMTEQKQAEEELRRRESQLQKMLEILPIGLWLADKNGSLVSGNPMGKKIWGAEPDIPISEYGVLKAWRLPSREPIDPQNQALAKTIRDGVTIVDELLEIETFDGKKKTILNYSTPVLDDNGEIDGAIVVNLDISDRTALEDQLLQSQKLESIGRLAGGVAHDFNNMLAVILGHTEMALDGLGKNQPHYHNLQEIAQAAERSADLTQQLLAFARKQTIAPRVIDLNTTVTNMLKMLQRLIGEDIKLAWIPGRNLHSVKIDPSQIDQVLANLCVNARDAIDDNGKITIETGNTVLDENYCAQHAGTRPGEFIMLAVSDNGCGMAAETRENVFEPFFTTKKLGKGTGLGLSTVYGIVKQNEGFINIYSEPGQGTTVKIYLPRLHDDTGKKPSSTAREQDAYGTETILLVEDEAAVLHMANDMLSRLGYTVLSANSPAEALLLAEQHAGGINLLITDVVMPGMNGRDLSQQLISLYPELKCLFISGYTANVIAHHNVLDEGVSFIQKPFSRKDIAAKVREVLDQ